ncbi:MAG: hypothetical protein MJ197_05335 [Bacteroidales bacterium]|nr:hypothetical protein [Bacteroidales bacterium]
MKRANVFNLLFLVIVGLSLVSCNKEHGTTEGTNYYSVVKMKQDYSKNVMGIEFKNKKYVQPCTPLGYENRFLQLKNGYWVTAYDKPLDGREVATDMSLDEYEKLYKEYAETNLDKIRDSLYSRIIDREPFEELYFVSIKDFSKYSEFIDEQHNTIEGPDLVKINEMIETGEFFTHESVKRIK